MTSQAETRDVVTTEFIVPGLPVPYTRMLKGDKSARAERYRAYREVVGYCAKQAGVEYVESGPMKLLVNVYIPDQMKRRWDVDNVLKGVSDALNGIAFKDDKQVIVAYGRVSDAVTCEPHVYVRVFRAEWQ